MQLRLATLDDADAIRAIYNLEVTTSTATFDLVPRSLEEQRAWLAARTGAHATVVAEAGREDGSPDGGEVVGFASLSPYKDRPAYRTTVEDSVYVRRDQHRRGVGRLLLGHILDVAADSGFHAVMARIEASGEASIGLHVACGFRVVGVERQVGRKFGRWLDVALLQCLLHEREGQGARSTIVP